MKNNLLNIKYPIIQAPMAGNILSSKFIANIANNGFLGMIPAGYLSLVDLEKMIKSVYSKLDRDEYSIGLNLFIENHKSQTLQKNQRVISLETSLIKNKNNSVEFEVRTSIDEDTYINLILKYNIKIVSMTFGLLSDKAITKLKNHGIKLIANATSIDEVIYSINKDIDIIIIQGNEAGGHQASFLHNQINKNTTLELLKSAKQKYPSKCFIAAGGISVNNMQNYFNAGTDYIQLGSAFMMTSGSNISKETKNHIRNNFSTVVSNNITGKYARGIANTLIKDSSIREYTFPIQHYHTANLRKYAKSENDFKLQSLWIGSNKDNIHTKNLFDFIKELKSKLNCIDYNSFD
ncbi:nitronate monooxygenase [Francisella sp. Scap27]|uniref:NAD(P)H-dependent flavin oxidoreductase n=1 Tax=Francisella sp. Scap27 TaxID=2589986 RepID=UPI0015BA57CA|nr:nitronate monooxygenase [Francisella sp. Scap27]QLE78656.1 nitronate monooxygenase [Francisella sp. Scap27]